MSNNLEKELRLSVEFFLEAFSKNELSYGLTSDRYPSSKENICSIAGTGFLFSALVIGVDFNYIEYQKAYDICLKAIKTIKNLETREGWYYHFYDKNNGEKIFWSELSNIDSCLLFLGLLTAGAFFKSEILDEALYILNRANFKFFLTEEKGKVFSMGVDYKNNFLGHWDRYAEQLMLYILGNASTNKEHKINKVPYYSFIRDKGSYMGHEFICSWVGSLFTYQYSQGYIDFRNTRDEKGVNWHENSVIASKVCYLFCKKNNKKFKSMNELSWGLTACACKDGYSGRYGFPPTGEGVYYIDGTIAPTAALSSIVFTPKESIKALDYFYTKERLIGKFGLKDSYNEDEDYYCDYYISIDKGMSMVMIANYLKETVWKYFNSLDIIKNSLKSLGIKKE